MRRTRSTISERVGTDAMAMILNGVDRDVNSVDFLTATGHPGEQESDVEARPCDT